MRTHRRQFLLTVAVLAALAALLLTPIPPRYDSSWVNAVLDLGHLPLMAVVTGLFGLILGRRWMRALAMAVGLAALLELGQWASGRVPSYFDFFVGTLGALLAVVEVHLLWAERGGRRATAALLLALLAFAWPLAARWPVLDEAYREYRRFPEIYGPHTNWNLPHWYTGGATVGRVAERGRDAWLGRITFHPREQGYSDVIFYPVVHDWRGYRRVCCEFSFAGPPLTVMMSVRDAPEVAPHLKRYNLRRTYQAGRHVVCFDLEQLAAGGPYSPVVLSRIHTFRLVVSGIQQPRTLYVHRLYLE